MKNLKIYALILSMLFFTGCSSSNGTYVNINDSTVQKDSVALDTIVGDFSFDDKPYTIMRTERAFSKDYFYEFSLLGNYCIDLKSGIVSGMCHKPGCSHTDSSVGCLNNASFQSPVGSYKGLYYVSDNSVKLYSGDSSEVVYENNYCTKYENEYMPDNKYALGAICYQNHSLYIIGATYFFIYDVDTDSISQPVTISDSAICSLCADEKHVYCTNENEELLYYDKENNSISKLADKTVQCCLYEGNLYYIQYEQGVPYLYSRKSPDAVPEKIIEDCYVNYCINSGYIYYQNFSSGRDMYVCRLDGSEQKRITLFCEVYDDNRELKEYDSQKLYYISTASHIDHVFVSDTDDGIVFAFKAGSENYETIYLGGDV